MNAQQQANRAQLNSLGGSTTHIQQLQLQQMLQQQRYVQQLQQQPPSMVESIRSPVMKASHEQTSPTPKSPPSTAVIDIMRSNDQNGDAEHMQDIVEEQTTDLHSLMCGSCNTTDEKCFNKHKMKCHNVIVDDQGDRVLCWGSITRYCDTCDEWTNATNYSRDHKECQRVNTYHL